MSVIIVTGKKGSDTTEDPPTVEIAVRACPSFFFEPEFWNLRTCTRHTLSSRKRKASDMTVGRVGSFGDFRVLSSPLQKISHNSSIIGSAPRPCKLCWGDVINVSDPVLGDFGIREPGHVY